MMFGIGQLSFALAVASTLLLEAAATPAPKQALRRTAIVSTANCHIVRAFAQEPNDRVVATWRAIPYGNNAAYEDQSFVINMTNAFVNDNGVDFAEGKKCATLTNANFTEINGVARVKYSAISVQTCNGSNSRIRPSGSGSSPSDVLVIRAIVSNDNPKRNEEITDPLSIDDLNNTIFNENMISLASQLRLCSNGASQIQGKNASRIGTGTPETYNIHKGILNVTIDVNKTDYLDKTVIENRMIVAARARLLGDTKALSEYDHVILCLPPQVRGVWESEGYAHWTRSLYYHETCLDVNHLMHEIGRNFGLHKTSDQYGMMGPSVKGNPEMCYDPVNSWSLGWYEDVHKEVTDLDKEPWAGRISSIVDFVDIGDTDEFSKDNSFDFADEFSVLLKIDMKTGDDTDDLYVGFNDAESFNGDTKDFKNKLIVAKKGNIVETVETSANAMVKGGDGLKVPGFANVPERNVFIEVCDVVQEVSGITYFRVVINAQGNDYMTCDEARADLPFLSATISVQGTQTYSSGKVPQQFWRLGTDYGTTFLFRGQWEDCEGVRIEGYLSSRYKADACKQSNAKIICLKTCKGYLSSAEKAALKKAAGQIKAFSNTARSLPPPPVSQTGTTPAVGSQQGSCQDSPGVALCAQLRASSNPPTQVSLLCSSNKVSTQCPVTCGACP